MPQRNKGQLKIFFSYAESIGKTQAMLKAAQSVKSQGIDVLVGYIAPHSPKNLGLLERLGAFLPIAQRR